MSPVEGNEDLARRYFKELHDQENPKRVDEIVAPDCVLHVVVLPETEREPGLKDIGRFVARDRKRFPDQRRSVEDMKAEGNKVVVRWTSHGAHKDAGTASTDGETLTGITSFRIANGKIVEIWEGYDALGKVQAPSVEEKQKSPSFQVIGETLAAYIGIPALLLYPVGLLVLAFQLMASNSLEFLTAWYAVSLVPTTVVAGQGVKVLLMPLLVSLAVSLAVAHTQISKKLKEPEKIEGEESNSNTEESEQRKPKKDKIESDQLKQQENPLRGVDRLKRQLQDIKSLWDNRKELWSTLWQLLIMGASHVTKYLSIIVAISTMIIVFGLLVFDYSIPFFSSSAVGIPFLIFAVVSGVMGGRKIAKARLGRERDDKPERTAPLGKDWFWRGVEERWIFGGLLWAYFGGVLCAFSTVGILWLFNLQPDLPLVRMIKSDTAPSTEVKVWSEEPPLLLSHSDSYWHVINPLKDQDVFLSVPDDHVDRVTVLEGLVADLGLTMSVLPEDVAWIGNDLTYTLEVTNDGPDTATDVEVTNYLPQDVSLVSVTPSQGKCSDTSSDTSSMTCNLDNLAKDASATVEIVVRPTTEGVLTNTASVESEDTNDPEAENDEVKQDVTVKVDTTAPTTEASPDPNVDWSDRDVTVSLAAEDNEGSGVKEISYSGAQEILEKTVDSGPAPFAITEEGETTITFQATDNAGNVEDADPSTSEEEPRTLTVKIDKTPPVISDDCEPADNEWNIDDVSFDCTASDELSGLVDNADASFTLSTDVPDGTEDDNASTTGSPRYVYDAAGNYAEAGPISGNKVDKKAPDITINTPGDDARYTLEESVEADYSCTDNDGSGVDEDECKETADNGSEIDTSSVSSKDSPKAFEVEATDKVGNTGSESRTYHVIYDFTSDESPILAENPSEPYVIKAGDAVLVKFSLDGDRGLDIFAAGYPLSSEFECDGQDSGISIEKDSLQYDADLDHYTYVWNTDETWDGTCQQLILKLKDGTEYSANFKFTG